MKIERIPFFMDVTLRDGNQALKKPWGMEEKIKVFSKLIEVGVAGAEVGFASASKTDFDSCVKLSKLSPQNLVISSLSRAVQSEIEQSYEAIKYAGKPRIHIVFPVSRYAIESVLKIDLKTAREKVLSVLRFTRKLIPKNMEIQFSGEHFGDSSDNLEFALELFQSALNEGVNVINLPNTVERTRPFHFVNMVKKIVSGLPANSIVSVHTHNDLGMATATTVESFFEGATQLEVTLNGLGERAGNTNLYEVACALKNSGVEVPLNFEKFYETAQFISTMSSIPIPEKAPIIGEDVFSHRSGIHQDGVIKTRDKQKNLYGAFSPDSVGRTSGHVIQFTSQSGKSVLLEILSKKNYEVHPEKILGFQKFLKEKSDLMGNFIQIEQIPELYEEFESGVI